MEGDLDTRSAARVRLAAAAAIVGLLVVVGGAIGGVLYLRAYLRGYMEATKPHDGDGR